MKTARLTTRRKSTRPSQKSRPVPEILLELAYYLHTTQVVGKIKGPRPLVSSVGTKGL
jgi:hypothetical protein